MPCRPGRNTCVYLGEGPRKPVFSCARPASRCLARKKPPRVVRFWAWAAYNNTVKKIVFHPVHFPMSSLFLRSLVLTISGLAFLVAGRQAAGALILCDLLGERASASDGMSGQGASGGIPLEPLRLIGRIHRSVAIQPCSGLATSSSYSSGSGTFGQAAIAWSCQQLFSPTLVARLRGEGRLIFPIPPPSGLLRPPRC